MSGDVQLLSVTEKHKKELVNRAYYCWTSSLGSAHPLSPFLRVQLQPLLLQVGAYVQHMHIKPLVCSLAVLDPKVGHTMDVLSPFIPVL